jgi:hypothetical protein
MKKCKHLFCFRELNEKGEIYYCQKCLINILVTRWKNVILIVYLDKNRKFKVLGGKNESN